MRKRRKLNKQFDSAISPNRKDKIKEKLVKIEVLLQNSHREARQRKEQLAANAIKTNPRYFFSYAIQFSVTKTKIGPLLNKITEYTSSSFEMANILAKQYSSVFSTPISSPYFTTEEENDIPTC